MKKLEELKSSDPNDIYCIGDNLCILKFEIGSMNWMRIPVDNEPKSQEAFDGTLRYSSCCYVPPCPDARIIVTGGCYSTNGFPSNTCTEFFIKDLRHPKKKRTMFLKRYGHTSVYLNSNVYVIGGFAHKDLPSEQPVTLNACERFSANTERRWNHITALNEPRAFASFVTFNS
jgi:hypothetical protein